MITLTKEWLLKTIAELEEERDAVPGVVNVDAANALASMKIALASLEAEKGADPVAFINGAWTLVYYRPPKELGLKIGDKLFAAPPAPVVPDEWEQWIADVVEYLEGGLEADGELEAEGSIEAKRLLSRRAAMLQGAEPVTTAYKFPFEQWLSQQTGTIDVECGCVMTEVFFHWLRVAYEAGNSPVAPDGWVLVPEEPTHEMLEAGDEQFGTYDVYRRMIAASPQQK